MPNQSYYSTITDVKTATGITAADLQLAADSDLDTFIENLLFQVADIINTDRKKDYAASNTYNPDGTVLTSSVPAGIHNIALRIVSNYLALITTRRRNEVVVIDNRMTPGIVTATILSQDIQKDLSKYPRGLPSYFKKYLPTTT